MPKYRNQTFRNSKDIDAFFSQFGATGFVDWFDKNISGRGKWVRDNGSRIEIGRGNQSNWSRTWDNISVLFGKDVINLVEFLCLNSIMINETGGNFLPISERVGTDAYPGLAYAFDRIPDLKKSYNTLETNKTAKELFNSSAFVGSHGTKGLGDKLKFTTDNRWAGDTMPRNFSSLGVSKETDKEGKFNGFLYEADFMKFRGRGLIQTTGRSGYRKIVEFILKYTGGDPTILNYKKKWSGVGSIDDILSVSWNYDWDQLFLNSNFIISNYAVYRHSADGGAKGIKFYTHIDSNWSDQQLNARIRDVGYSVAGGRAHEYAQKFFERVIIQLNKIEGIQAGPITSEPSTFTNPPDGGGGGGGPSGGEGGSSNTYGNASQGIVVRQEIVNVFPPTLKASEIRFDLPTDTALRIEYLTTLGLIPFVWYGGYQISPKYIKYLEIGTSPDGIPQLKLTFIDEFGLIKDKAFPLDDTKITIFINPRSPQFKSIHMDFKITSYKDMSGTYTIVGLMDCNRLYIKEYTSYSNKTAFDALQEIAKAASLGFSTNVDTTNDSMLWIQNGRRNIEFIQEISKHSFISDQTFATFYIDFYYNLTLVDIEKELKRDLSQEIGISNTGIEKIAKMTNDDFTTKPILTNEKSVKDSVAYFEEYKIFNKSTEISISEGYSTKIKYYDEKQKRFLVFDVDGNTSNADSSIIMKGSPQDEGFFNSNKNLVYMGKLDTSNMHANYQYARIQNFRNLTELEKVGIEIELGNPNYNLFKYRKIRLVLSNIFHTISKDILNNRLSGDWLIIDIKYVFDGNKYIQKVRLVKRELNLSDEELSKELVQTPPNTETQGGGSNNPIPPGLTGASGGLTASGSTASLNPTGVAPNFYGTQSAPPVEADNVSFPLTKELFKEIYKNFSVPEILVERYYKPLVKIMIEYNIKSKERIAAFIVMVNQESSYLKNVTEETDGSNYENKANLGNTQPGDGAKYRSRGLIKVPPGRKRYEEIGNYFKKDFVTDPTVVAADNQTQLRGSMTDAQIENSILTAVKLWVGGTSWYGDLRFLSDLVTLDKPLKYGNFKDEELPNTNNPNVIGSEKYEELNLFVNKNDNFATKFAPGDLKAVSFLLICFAVTDSYDGFRDRVIAWNRIRDLLK